MVDKYDDPNYGNTFKTVNSIFTVREIEMFCREWDWNHVEHFIQKPGSSTPQNWIMTEGIGYFIGTDGNEYNVISTFRDLYYRISPYNLEEKEEFKKHLKKIAGDYYFKGSRDQYYFYDVLMPPGDHVHDAYSDPVDGKNIENPSASSLEVHGKKFGRVILHHVGVSNGKMWDYIKKAKAIVTTDQNFWEEHVNKLTRNCKVTKNDLRCVEFENGCSTTWIKNVTNDLCAKSFDEFIIDDNLKLTRDEKTTILTHTNDKRW